MTRSANQVPFREALPIIEEIRRDEPGITAAEISRRLGRSEGYLSTCRGRHLINRESLRSLRTVRDDVKATRAELEAAAAAEPFTAGDITGTPPGVNGCERQTLEAGASWKERDGDAALEQAIESLRELVEKIDQASGAPTFTGAEHDRLELVTRYAERAIARRRQATGNGRLIPRERRATPIASDLGL